MYGRKYVLVSACRFLYKFYELVYKLLQTFMATDSIIIMLRSVLRTKCFKSAEFSGMNFYILHEFTSSSGHSCVYVDIQGVRLKCSERKLRFLSQKL